MTVADQGHSGFGRAGSRARADGRGRRRPHRKGAEDSGGCLVGDACLRPVPHAAAGVARRRRRRSRHLQSSCRGGRGGRCKPGLVSSHAAGFLDPKVAREVFGAPDALIAWGPPAGVARAIAVDGGYRVTGKWRFASGSANATWMGGHSTVFETADKPRRDAKGNAINRTVLFRRELANIKDTWHVIGLRGTSSNDYEVSDLFVPEEYTTWRDSVSDRRERGPLYNIPMLTLYGVGFSGVALGIAGSCLGAFMQLAQTKASGGGVGSTAVLRDNAVIQSRVARACGRLESARAFLLQMLREIWTASAGSGALSLEQRARLRIAITGAMEAARKVVDFAYRAAGTTAIFEGSPFERRFRDLHTLLAQGQAHLSNFESAGQALFGIEPAQRL